MLSSEILENQFGPTRLVVLKQNSTHRIIETVASDNKQVLELSIVTFDKENVDIFPDVHAEIIAGASIGKAFKKASVRFIRKINSTTHIPLPAILSSEFNQKGLATIVDVDIFVGEQKAHYCHILEVYSPAVSWQE